jgi:hypothetical protein
MIDMKHMNYLHHVVSGDVRVLQHKEKTYQGSWKKRGGTGAYFMVARKMDRLEIIAHNYDYDIFRAIMDNANGDDGTALAEIRDLRQYLILIEAEIMARQDHAPHKPIEHIAIGIGTPEDGGHHARQRQMLSDGLQNLDDLSPDEQEQYMLVFGDKAKFYIANRLVLPPDLWEHLPRLSIENNYKEYSLLPEYYQKLYDWNESASKWQMRHIYHEHWGKQ